MPNGLVAEAYEKANSINAPDTFSDELDDIEQVKVSLSEEALNLQEEQSKIFKIINLHNFQ